MLLSLTSVVPEHFLSILLECRHFRIRCLHALWEILAKCVVILTSKLKFSVETVLYCVVLCCVVLRCVALCCVVLYCIVLYYEALY